MKVSIIGSNGRIGSTLVKKLKQSGHEIVTAVDRDEPIDPEKLKSSDVTVLAVPLGEMEYLIEKYGEESLLVELSSVKSQMKRFAGRVISIHPLFGPSSYLNPDFNTVLFVDDISPAGSIDRIRELFPESEVVSVTAQEHDKSMASLLVAPYAISMIAKKLTAAHRKFVTPSFANLRKIATALDGENASVVKDTIFRNEFTGSILDEIDNEIMEIRSELN